MLPKNCLHFEFLFFNCSHFEGASDTRIPCPVALESGDADRKVLYQVGMGGEARRPGRPGSSTAGTARGASRPYLEVCSCQPGPRCGQMRTPGLGLFTDELFHMCLCVGGGVGPRVHSRFLQGKIFYKGLSESSRSKIGSFSGKCQL